MRKRKEEDIYIELLRFDGSTIESELTAIKGENEKMSKSLQDISDGLDGLAKELETNKDGNP